MTSKEDIEASEKIKDEGNKMFKEKKYSQAIDLYTQAIELNATPAVLCNRAFAHLKNDCAGAAMTDANQSIELDPGFVKAYYRRASAYVMIGKWKEALKDYRRVTQLRPGDADAAKKFKECDKEVKRQAFLLAIKTEEKGLMCDRLAVGAEGSWTNIPVPPSFSGPVIKGSKVDFEYAEALKDWMKDEKMPCKRDVTGILVESRGVLAAYPNVVPVNVPETGDIKLNLCGDVHGQYYDLLHLFKLGGPPGPKNWYLFNGDFVDRGSYSVECILLLLAYKLSFPEFIHMSRGNHEGRSLNTVYGFEGEVNAKLGSGSEAFDLFQEVFQALPLAHVINKKIFTVHGGLFDKDGVTIEMINKQNRFCDPDSGLLCHMLWSDPMNMPGRAPNKRGVGVTFGPDVTREFLATNGLEYIVRSHEVKDEGYVVEHGGKCITVFSAPNYCDSVGNKAAFITIKPPNYTPSYTVFESQKHPGKQAMAYSRMFQFQ
ncbi:Serine/threonine-protein phosphatase 5 [Diplonema papillatum]|nr:Serine/threonine-protein phosphatase 5 [Diplonema papillatum]